MTPRHSAAPYPSRIDLLLNRARRASLRGERRQALVALREATLLAQVDAKLWALYGAACLRAKRDAEAERAFGQALFLRQQARDVKRAKSLRDLLARLQSPQAA